MKIKDWFIHFFLYLGLLIVLCVFELFILRPVIDFFGNDFNIHLIIYLLLFILVNPLCTWLLAEKLIMVNKETVDE